MLLEYALSHGFTHIATGHYAKVVTLRTEDGTRYTLVPPKDGKKDQTYMLSRLSQDILSHIVFPLADEEKGALRATSTLQTKEKPDSQEICFIPDNDYRGYIEGVAGKFPEGDFVDGDGKILGKHKGIIGYTVGQRKGLGISLGKRAFVKEIDVDRNRVVLSTEDAKKDRITASDVVYMGMTPTEGEREIRALVKIRYTKAKEPATCVFSKDRIVITFDEPVSSPTPGQTATVHSAEGCLLASGIIE